MFGEPSQAAINSDFSRDDSGTDAMHENVPHRILLPKATAAASGIHCLCPLHPSERIEFVMQGQKADGCMPCYQSICTA